MKSQPHKNNSQWCKGHGEDARFVKRLGFLSLKLATKTRLSLSKLVSNLVYGGWILELLILTLLLRYEHRHLKPIFFVCNLNRLTLDQTGLVTVTLTKKLSSWSLPTKMGFPLGLLT